MAYLQVSTDLQSSYVICDAFIIDVGQKLLLFKNELLELNKTELKVLLHLAQKSGEALSPQKMAKLLEEESRFCTMTLFYFVNSFKAKLQGFSSHAFDLCFLKGEGLCLQVKPV